MQKLDKELKMISVKFYKEDLDFIVESFNINDKKLSSLIREYLNINLNIDKLKIKKKQLENN